MLHFEIWGPILMPSVHDHRYYLTALDDYSRYTLVILLKAKSEVSIIVKKVITMIENQNNTNVKVVRTNS